MAKRNSRQTQRDIYRINIKKLQRAGLIGDVDFRKKATPAIVRRLEKYKSVLVGKASVVQAPDLTTARNLRKTLGLKGSGKSIVIPREKGERYKLKKSTGEIVSRRRGFNEGEIIEKTLGSRFPAPPPAHSGRRLYYTIPERTRGAGRLKRKTFGSFDEMLFYMAQYDIDFSSLEDRIEVEEITTGSRFDKLRQRKIHDERAAGIKRAKRRRATKRRKGRR